MSSPPSEGATSLSLQTLGTTTTITGQEPVASPTSLDSHNITLSPRDPNPNQADAMFGPPLGSSSTMGSMGRGCGCAMFNTASGDEGSLCALHSAVPVTSLGLLRSGDEISPCVTDSHSRAVPVTTSSLLAEKTARVVDGNETSESRHDRLTVS